MMIDVVGILLIVVFFVRGYSKGIIVAAFSMLAILFGIICSLKLSHALAAWLLAHGYVTSGWAQLVSYLVLFIGVFLIVRLIAKAIETAVQAVMLGIINKLIGGVLYAFVGAVLWSSLLWIANQMHLISPETIAASKTYNWMSALAPWVCENIGKMLPFVKNTFTGLQEFFESVNQKLPQHVGAH